MASSGGQEADAVEEEDAAHPPYCTIHKNDNDEADSFSGSGIPWDALGGYEEVKKTIKIP